MSAFTVPVLINSEGVGVPLTRIGLGSTSENVFPEKWLQAALYRSPDCLPVTEFDPHIGKLIPLCQEIQTGAGPADIIYVTPTGQIVLVETKLWRNPQARREVVAQILDYAKQLTSWTFDVLDQQVANATKGGIGRVLRRVREKFPDIDEAAFVDGVNRSLAAADFLLLIVGDGIRDGATGMVGFLENYGHLRFRLGIIEVAAYCLPNGDVLIQPRILAKTEILERTIFVGPSGPLNLQQAIEAVEAREDDEDKNSSKREWFGSFWREFLEKVRTLAPEEILPEPGKGTNQYFLISPRGDKAWISAYLAKSAGNAGVYLTFSRNFGLSSSLYQGLFDDKEAIEAEIGIGLSWSNDAGKVWISVPLRGISNLDVASERIPVIDYLATMSLKMIASFRPRLEALLNQLN